jgi:hypothetical protein
MLVGISDVFHSAHYWQETETSVSLMVGNKVFGSPCTCKKSGKTLGIQPN